MQIGQVMQKTSDPLHGMCFFVVVGVILWKCKKQPTIALFTIEAEYMTTSHCTKETVWFKQLLADVEYV